MASIKQRLQNLYYLLRGGDCLRGVEDEDTARTFHLILSTLLVWLILQNALILPWFVFRKTADVIISGILGGMALASMALLRRQRKRPASLLFLCVNWCVIEIFIFLSRGTHSTAVGWTLALVILAGWLLGRSSALSFAAASVLVLFIEAVMEIRGFVFSNYFPGGPINLLSIYLLFLVLAVIPVFSFLDEMRKQLSALRDSEARFSSLSNAALEGIMIHQKGVILDANKAYARLFGYDSPEELIGQFGPNLLLAPESRARTLERIEQHTSGVMELEGLRKDGTTFLGEMDARAIRYRNCDATLISTRDVTARKRAEEEKNILQAQLVQAQKLEVIGRLAGSISHDFNNLLTVILGSCELLLDNMEAADPLRESLEEIHAAGERAAGLTQQLLAFSRKQVLQPRVFDLNALIQEMQPILIRIAGNNVQLELDLASDPMTICADPLQMDSVIMNLVVNARDAMPKGGRIQIQTASVNYSEPPVNEHRGGTYVTFAIRDSGMGMSEETKSRIFEPFFTAKEIGKGTGLGLSVTRGIVEQSGGNIEIQSELGQGTTFTVYLPLASYAAIDSDKRQIGPRARGTATVLVAEDHPDVRKFTISALKSSGYRVIEAESPHQALDLFDRERGRIDLILTDVVMPELSGREMVNTVRTQWPHVKALFMSGYSDDAVLQHGVLERDSGFIQKPFSASQLAAKIEELLVESVST